MVNVIKKWHVAGDIGLYDFHWKEKSLHLLKQVNIEAISQKKKDKNQDTFKNIQGSYIVINPLREVEESVKILILLVYSVCFITVIMS